MALIDKTLCFIVDPSEGAVFSGTTPFRVPARVSIGCKQDAGRLLAETANINEALSQRGNQDYEAYCIAAIMPLHTT